jgi:outer membrane lipoprotein-sorting protein
MNRRRFAAVVALLFLGGATLAYAQTDAAAPDSAGAKKAAAKKTTGAKPDAEKELADPKDITWHAQALAHGPGGLNVTQFWSKGSKLRAETVISGHKVVTLVNGEWYYAYDATKGLGIRVRRTPASLALDMPFRRPFGNEAIRLIEMGAEVVGEENYHGREADVYRLTDRLGRRTIWASKDALNIPLHVEIYNRQTGQTQATDYLDWLTGLTIPDSYFDVDPNVAITSYEFEEYGYFMSQSGSVGPVPVLYSELLRGW